jgi:hypothetical protein
MMLVLVFAVWLGWLPAQGSRAAAGTTRRSPSGAAPAITIGVIEGRCSCGSCARRLQATGQDFVRTAAAKGLTRTQALVRHGLPSVGLSIITVLGLQVAGIIVGAVVIEQLFSLPGIGRMLVADVGQRDLPKVQGELLVLTGFVLVIGFVVDLVHRVIDPRQRRPNDRPEIPGSRGCTASGRCRRVGSASSSCSSSASPRSSRASDALRPAEGRRRESVGCPASRTCSAPTARGATS